MKMSLKNLAYTFAAAGMMVFGGYSSANAQESSKPKNTKPTVDSTFSLMTPINLKAFDTDKKYKKGVEDFYRGVGSNPDLRLKFLNPVIANTLFKSQLNFTPVSAIAYAYKEIGNERTTGLQRYVGGRVTKEGIITNRDSTVNFSMKAKNVNFSMKADTAELSIYQFEWDLNHDGKFSTIEDIKLDPDAKTWQYKVSGPNKKDGTIYGGIGYSSVGLKFSPNQITRQYEEQNFAGEIIERGEEVIRKKHTPQGDVLVYVMPDGSENPVVNGHISANEKFNALIEHDKELILENYNRMQRGDLPEYGWAKEAFGKISEDAKVTPKVLPRMMAYFPQLSLRLPITDESMKDTVTAPEKIDYKKMEMDSTYRVEVLKGLFKNPVGYFGQKNVRPANGTNITMSSDTVQHLIKYEIASEKVNQDTLRENVFYTRTQTIDVFYDEHNAGLPDEKTHTAGYVIEKQSWPKGNTDNMTGSVAHISFDRDIVNFDIYRMSGNEMTLQKKQTFFKGENGNVCFRESDKDQPFPDKDQPLKVEAKDGRQVTLEEIRDSFVDMFRRGELPKLYYNPYKLPDKPKN